MPLHNALLDVTADFSEIFEKQRRDFGGAHRIGNEIRTLSKQGVAMLEFGDMTAAENCEKKIKELWKQLYDLSLPEDICWQFDSENGQEMVEFIIVKQLFPYLDPSADLVRIDSLPSYENLQVTRQTWMAGLGDVVGELSKLQLRRLCDHNLDRKQRLALRRRFVEIAETIRGALGQFETAYPIVVNNSRRRGFFNTFRGVLVRMDNLIERHLDAIATMLDQSAR